MRCSREQCPIYTICSNPRINKRMLPCQPIHEAANNQRPASELPVDAEMLDQIDNRHYLDVINEVAEGIRRRRALPRLIAPALWRRLIIQALTIAQVPTMIIADVLNISTRTVRRERKQPLP